MVINVGGHRHETKDPTVVFPGHHEPLGNDIPEKYKGYIQPTDTLNVEVEKIHEHLDKINHQVKELIGKAEVLSSDLAPMKECGASHRADMKRHIRDTEAIAQENLKAMGAMLEASNKALGKRLMWAYGGIGLAVVLSVLKFFI